MGLAKPSILLSASLRARRSSPMHASIPSRIGNSVPSQASSGHQHWCGTLPFSILLLTLLDLPDVAEEHSDPQTLP